MSLRESASAAWLLLHCAFAAAANGVVHHVDPGHYLAALRALRPGHELHLAPGAYLKGLPVEFINGTAEAPIVITGPATGAAARLLARAGHNTVSLRNASHVVIRNLTLDGQGIPVDAVKCEGDAQWAHHIRLENLKVVGHGANQQVVGISTKCPAWNWVVRRNIIEGAGTGMYFGDSDGSAPFVAGLIEYNLVTESLGYNLQIKHQQERDPIPGMPVTPQATIIRHNVFSKGQHASRGDFARPNVLVGHWPLRGSGADDLYLIYGNFFFQNPTEALFQGEGRIALYNNLFVNAVQDALHIQPHNDRPRYVRVLYNTVLTRAAGITLIRRPEDEQPDAMVAGNIVFAARPVAGYRSGDNLIGDYAAARRYLLNPYAAPPQLDLGLSEGEYPRPLTTFAQAENLRALALDFDGQVRTEGVPGAYGDRTRDRQWALQLQRKPSTKAVRPR